MGDFASVYRLQFNAEFTFEHAIEILDYLQELGVEAVYGSPIYQAVEGSAHGYDITSPLEINRVLGGEEGFLRLIHALKERGMAFIIDHVPNHMAAHIENPWWFDVLKDGRSSSYAPFFDIDWDASDKILLPILPKPPHECDLEKVSASLGLPEEGHYRLAYFQEAREELNYRRFFDIIDLVCVCIENDAVFEAYHEKLFDLVDKGLIDGIRIDHPDGLLDPRTYFKKLKERTTCDLIVEKILQVDETLRSDWAVDGTVGYEALQALTNVFVNAEAKEELHTLYEKALGREIDHEESLVIEKKSYLLLYLNSELKALSSRFCRELEEEDMGAMRRALAILLAVFPTYRTYLDRDEETSETDQKIWMRAFEEARFRDGTAQEMLDRLEEAFLHREAWPLFLRFQQLSPAVMAKGFEDTHCYTFNRFIALNEVGCNPDHFGGSIDTFHAKNQQRLDFWPRSWQTGSTHDTKRSEDVRMRLASLSEIPDQFGSWLERFFTLVGSGFTERNTLYFYFQTLLGVWPEISKDRLTDYMIKAAREAKIQTNWSLPNENFENQLRHLIDRTLSDKAFCDHLSQCIAVLAPLGELNSISALTLRMASPGVIDIYQGNERSRYDLVDPDNRRPIDFNGKVDEKKLHVVKSGLAMRKELKDVIMEGDYEPLDIEGGCAFIRRGETATILCVAGRFFSKGFSLRSETIHLSESGTWEALYSGENISQGRDFSLDCVTETYGSEIFIYRH